MIKMRRENNGWFEEVVKNGKVYIKEKRKERDTEDRNLSDFVCLKKQKIEHRGLSHLQLSLLMSLFILITLTVLIVRQDQKRILYGVHFEIEKSSFDFHTVCKNVVTF